MKLEQAYPRAKRQLLADANICNQNKELFRKFLEYEEYKLKRLNGLPRVDEASCKTLLAYTSRLRVVNRWFGNKPWSELTRQDIQSVYDAVEDGEIKSSRGMPLKDKVSYYKMVLRGKPFEMAGKKALVEEVLQYAQRRHAEEVRFVREESFRKLVDVSLKVEQRGVAHLCIIYYTLHD